MFALNQGFPMFLTPRIPIAVNNIHRPPSHSQQLNFNQIKYFRAWKCLFKKKLHISIKCTNYKNIVMIPLRLKCNFQQEEYLLTLQERITERGEYINEYRPWRCKRSWMVGMSIQEVQVSIDPNADKGKWFTDSEYPLEWQDDLENLGPRRTRKLTMV